jgi:hypothetical protein
VGVVVGEIPGERLGGHAGGGGEGAGGFAFDGGADDPPAGGLPGIAGGGHGGRLAGAGPADGALDAVAAGAEGAYEVALLVDEPWLPREHLVDDSQGNERGAAVQAVPVAGHDALLDGKDLAGGVAAGGEGDHVAGGEKPVRK